MAQTLVIAGSGKAPAALHFYDLLEDCGLLIHSQGMVLWSGGSGWQELGVLCWDGNHVILAYCARNNPAA